MRTLPTFLACVIAGAAAAASIPVARTVTGDELGDWMRPLLSVNDEGKAQVTPRYLEKKRLVIPSPALLIAFSESGCIVAAKPVEAWSGWPTACLQGSATMPDAATFLSLARVDLPSSPAKRILALVSPLYDADRLKVMFPGKVSGIDDERVRLQEIGARLKADNEDVYVVQVPIAL